MIRIDLVETGLRSNLFDVIICNHVLEHISQDGKAMDELLRNLKLDGWALLQVPSHYHYQALSRIRKWQTQKNDYGSMGRKIMFESVRPVTTGCGWRKQDFSSALGASFMSTESHSFVDIV